VDLIDLFHCCIHKRDDAAASILNLLLIVNKLRLQNRTLDMNLKELGRFVSVKSEFELEKGNC